MIYIFLIRGNVIEEITIDRDGVSELTLEVDDLRLVPASEKEYIVEMKAKATGHYTLSMFYYETDDGGMSQYVDVVISYMDNVVYEGRLSELIRGKEILCDIDLLDGSITELKFCYKMSEEVGNEAQGTTTSFNISLAIKRRVDDLWEELQ
jgi:hypothetical protein